MSVNCLAGWPGKNRRRRLDAEALQETLAEADAVSREVRAGGAGPACAKLAVARTRGGVGRAAETERAEGRAGATLFIVNDRTICREEVASWAGQALSVPQSGQNESATP